VRSGSLRFVEVRVPCGSRGVGHLQLHLDPSAVDGQHGVTPPAPGDEPGGRRRVEGLVAQSGGNPDHDPVDALGESLSPQRPHAGDGRGGLGHLDRRRQLSTLASIALRFDSSVAVSDACWDIGDAGCAGSY